MEPFLFSDSLNQIPLLEIIIDILINSLSLKGVFNLLDPSVSSINITTPYLVRRLHISNKLLYFVSDTLSMDILYNSKKKKRNKDFLTSIHNLSLEFHFRFQKLQYKYITPK